MAKLTSGTRIYGNTTIDTFLVVSGTNASNSTSNGAIVVAGGVGVGGNVYASGIYEGTTRVLDTANTYMNSRISANVASINGSITSNVGTLSGYISANVSALNGSISGNAETIRLNTNSYINSNVAAINSSIAANVTTINGRITSNAVSTNAFTNLAFSQANTAQITALAAFDAANTKLSASGGTVSGALNITGNTYTNALYANNDLRIGANSQLRFDTANNFLGVNKAAPVYTLDVDGSGYFTGNVIITGNLQVQGGFSSIATANLDVATNVITMSAGLTTSTTPTSNNSLVINRGNQTNTYIRWLENGISGGEWVISSNGNTDGIIVNTENTFKDWSSYSAANDYKKYGLAIGGTLGWSISNQANAAYATGNAAYSTANAGYATANAGYSHANAAFAIANTATTNIVVLDDIGNHFDGIERTFDLHLDTYPVNIIAPEQLLVQINGLVVSPYINTTDVVFASGFQAFTKGYTVANTGAISQVTFASAPQTNMDCFVRVLTPNQTSAAQTKKYPFSPISIVTGY